MKSSHNDTKDRLQAADLLYISNYRKEAVIFYWHVIRQAIFRVLFEKEMEFKNTDEAVMKIIQLLAEDSLIAENLQFFENIATMCEWKFDFELSDENASRMQASFHQIINKLNTHVKN